jgi:hypothetical protein
MTYHASLGATQAVWLNLTNGAGTNSAYWNNTAPTSSVFTVAINANQSANNYVAYLFAEVPGFSRFGNYTGNGSADGPFVFCGFRPRWVMIKRTDAGGDNWIIHDTARSANNVMGFELYPSASAAESGALTRLDALSNGFKIRVDSTASNYNANGGTYIFAAFAENPFKYSLAR